jgi:hypothetical protein
MLTAAIGVIGVVAGAVLTGVIALYRERVQEKANLEGNIRVLALDLIRLDSLVRWSLEDGVARFSKADVGETTDTWLQARALIARKLGAEQWAIVARVFQTALVWTQEDGRALNNHDQEILGEWLARLGRAQTILEHWPNTDTIGHS